MEKQSSLFAILIVSIGLVAAAVIFKPVVDEQLAPELVAAWVAIEVLESAETTDAETTDAEATDAEKTNRVPDGVANVGSFVLEVGTPFKLHAVLEARDRSGEAVYYTEASRLSFAGKEVPVESLRVWNRPQPIKVRWFTVEGPRPFVTLDLESGIEAFQPEEFLRSDWPLSWSVPGEIDAAHDSHLENVSAEKIQRFGTQRYHVRIEFYGSEEALIPERVIRSWGVSDLKSQIQSFPTVRLLLPGPAGPASRVFGLTQLNPPPDASEQILNQITALAKDDLAFSSLTVIGAQIRQTGKSSSDLEWTSLDLAAAARWGEDVAPGDLLRVGNRIVVLYDDRGVPGVLDYPDLCFDYVQGASVSALSDVFFGSGSIVEHASLTKASPSS